ncbi:MULTISPECIES: MerC domain-containing protein [Flavobacteriaceae]|uniref:MerC domain-containing protein n=1 Tax=Flavobacteriaceae TaxID=49546 RepID=UPI0014909295|nr:MULTISPECIES: MerC domain-containing protein [Allomuricauda]MDC6366507.1 MerC domain-containing protein [Muricauda sp. AC10]
MKLIQLASKSDIIGATASGLCLVHCLATPFLFIAQAGLIAGGEASPPWWGAIDLFFLIISFFAIIWSNKTTSKKWVGYALWACWLLLAFVVLNEKLSLVSLAEEAVYIPALGLVFFHLYNRKYCQCER